MGKRSGKIFSKIPQLHKNKVAIVGNPNVGKSALFNQLTNAYSLVANFPHTTISVSRADVVIGGEKFEIIDTPGIMSLNIQSEDGLVTRDILLQEHPELIILCLDATNMKRSLLLASQIFELNVPLVICLNFIDEARQKGIAIDRKKLKQMLGVPVVETVASEGRGIKELVRQLPQAAVPTSQVRYKALIERGKERIASSFPADAQPSDAIALMLLQHDEGIRKLIRPRYGTEIMDAVQRRAARIQSLTEKPLDRTIFEERSRWAQRIADAIIEQHSVSWGKTGEIIGALCRHRFAGWIILAGIIYFTYFLVGNVGANILAPVIEKQLFSPVNRAIGSRIPWDLVREFAVGDYGILTTGFANAVGTVLPILTMFFLLLNFLEDCGYITNLCILSNRVFKTLGLSGQAILPIILGFGCKTIATLATRILMSKKERYIAIFLIAFAIPCSSQLGINLAILALFPFVSFLIVFGVLAAVEIAAGLSLNLLIKEENVTDFIMEIPPIRFPNIKNLLVKTYYRLKWFLIEAVPLFIIGAFVLFLMDKLYILEMIRRGVSPVIVTWLNLPIKTVDAFILCLARHEAGAVILMNMVTQHQLDHIQAMVSIIVLTCFVPCFANIMAMIKELGMRRALIMVVTITVVSIIIGGIVNYVLRVW
jgi:ferrous iron transport protein B